MVRRAALLALVLCLAACGSGEERAPFTDSRLPPGLGPKDWPPHNWAWGLIRTGDAPAQRYGVAAAATVPRAQVLIQPGYGDFAETHFAEVSALIDRGDTVWTLDGVGQGGSGRSVAPRDLGHLGSFDDDVRGLSALIHQVIRPPVDTPLVVVADGTAAPVALRALQQNQIPVTGLILIDPVLQTPGSPNLDQAGWASRFGLGAIRAHGAVGWVRNDQLTDPDQARRMAWQTANPDLRMGGPSLGWQAEFNALIQTISDNGWRDVQPPVLLLTTKPSSAADNVCRALPHCTRQTLDGAHSLSDAEAAFIQDRMGPDALAPWTAPVAADDDRPSTILDVPRQP